MSVWLDPVLSFMAMSSTYILPVAESIKPIRKVLESILALAVPEAHSVAAPSPKAK